MDRAVGPDGKVSVLLPGPQGNIPVHPIEARMRSPHLYGPWIAIQVPPSGAGLRVAWESCADAGCRHAGPAAASRWL